MQKHYVTLTGKKIDLGRFTDEERLFLGRAVKAYQAGEAYPNFVNQVNAPGSPALGGGEWVTEEVAASPLYLVCQDLADRLGVAQGFLSLGENSATGTQVSIGEDAMDFVSSGEAAHLAGITAEAIRKAIREERLPARRVGRTYLVDRRAVEAYRATSRWNGGGGQQRWRTSPVKARG